MRPLFIGLYAEGASDERFLPALIARTVRRILTIRERYPVDVVTPQVIRVPGSVASGEVERLITAAHYAMGCNLLAVHLDAGAPTRDLAMQHRFQPGLKRVQEAEGQMCRQLVPVIPIREIEAWMIADLDTLMGLINPGISVEEVRRTAAHELRLAQRPHEVETDQEPKQTLKQIIRLALSNRRRGRRNMKPEELHVQLGESVRLDVMDGIPAYAQLVTDTTQALIEIGVARADHEL
jgi:hypothetical protein